MPKFRNLWEHIRAKMPKKGRGKADDLDPLSLPVELQTALEALYGHYEKTFELWDQAGHPGSSLLHRGLQQHLHLEAGLRLHLRLPARRTRTAPPRWRTGAWRCSAISTSTATRSPAAARC